MKLINNAKKISHILSKRKKILNIIFSLVLTPAKKKKITDIFDVFYNTQNN